MDRVGYGKARTINGSFRAMVSHFLFEAEFSNPVAGREKGQIEKNVRDARPRIWHQAPCFASLAALNDWLEQRCQALWNETIHPEQKDRTLAAVWHDEEEVLMAAPRSFDGFVEQILPH